tara:strand:- start:508 stop:768 length:261 start_codon:yes stop_codon:yes gene_type:complete
MAILGGIIFFIGIAISLVGGIWFLIEAFKESIWWGLGCLLISFVSLIFLCMHFQAVKKPFFIQLAGLALLIIGSFMMPEATVAPTP